jgi:hypothetical protein
MFFLKEFIMSTKVDVGLTGSLAIIALFIAGVIGWIMNIMAIAGSEFTPITGLLVLRVVGIFVAPLGAVLGWC